MGSAGGSLVTLEGSEFGQRVIRVLVGHRVFRSRVLAYSKRAFFT